MRLTVSPVLKDLSSPGPQRSTWPAADLRSRAVAAALALPVASWTAAPDTTITATRRVQPASHLAVPSAGADLIWPQFFSEQQRSNFRFEIKTLAKEKWETVEIPLADFFRLSDGARLQDGDHFTWFGIAVAGAAGDIYFDDVELVEMPK